MPFYKIGSPKYPGLSTPDNDLLHNIGIHNYASGIYPVVESLTQSQKESLKVQGLIAKPVTEKEWKEFQEAMQRWGIGYQSFG